ncbi:hypothetical protein HDU87_001935 [Geranomyces variabilis]|uniref:Uncharacterized protein n=1 Tax=Geranomyces variabilis TaxID=109894 RepID=A0AAD5XNI9_9FUNG|nr:hypothetical protein HDU87_001935 [Geranomyces variabilis]
MSSIKSAPSAVRPSTTSAATATATASSSSSAAPSSAPTPPPQTTFLDLPADDPASVHLASLLLLGKPQQAPAAAARQRPKTFKPEPPSALLSRVAAFLPQLSAANADLQTSIAADAALRDRVDIENVDEDDEQYIEMNLGVGVFDTQPIPADGSRPRRSDDDDEDHEVSSPEREIIMTTDAPDAEHSRPMIEVMSDTRTADADSDGGSSGDSDFEEK